MKQISLNLSKELLGELSKRKKFEDESYGDIIWGLVECKMELSEETKKGVVEGRKQIKEGKSISFEQVRKRFNI